MTLVILRVSLYDYFGKQDGITLHLLYNPTIPFLETFQRNLDVEMWATKVRLAGLSPSLNHLPLSIW